MKNKKQTVDSRTRGDVIRFPRIKALFDFIQAVTVIPVFLVIRAFQRLILGKEEYENSVKRSEELGREVLQIDRRVRYAEAMEKELKAALADEKNKTGWNEIKRLEVYAVRDLEDQSAYKINIVLRDGKKLSLFMDEKLVLFNEDLCPKNILNKLAIITEGMKERLVGLEEKEPDAEGKSEGSAEKTTDDENKEKSEKGEVSGKETVPEGIYARVSEYKQGTLVKDISTEKKRVELVAAVKSAHVFNCRDGEMAKLCLQDAEGRQIDALIYASDYTKLKDVLDTDKVMKYIAVSGPDKETGDPILQIRNILEAEPLEEKAEETPKEMEKAEEPDKAEPAEEKAEPDFDSMSVADKLALRDEIIAEEESRVDVAEACDKYGITLDQLTELDELNEEMMNNPEEPNPEVAEPFGIEEQDEEEKEEEEKEEKEEFYRREKIIYVTQGAVLMAYLAVGEIHIKAERALEGCVLRLSGDVEKIADNILREKLKEITEKFDSIKANPGRNPYDGSFAVEMNSMVQKDIENGSIPEAVYVYRDSLFTVNSGEKEMSVVASPIHYADKSAEIYSVSAADKAAKNIRSVSFYNCEKNGCRDAVLSAYTLCSMNPDRSEQNQWLRKYEIFDGANKELSTQVLVRVGGKYHEGKTYELQPMKEIDGEYYRITGGQDLGTKMLGEICREYLPAATGHREEQNEMIPKLSAALKTIGSEDYLLSNGVLFCSKTVEDGHENLCAVTVEQALEGEKPKSITLANGFNAREKVIEKVIGKLLDDGKGIGYIQDDKSVVSDELQIPEENVIDTDDRNL